MNLLRIISLSLLLSSADLTFAQLSPQSNKMTEKFFPDPEIEINTPAFSMKKGFTEYDDMMAYLNALLASHSDQLKMEFIGTSQKGDSIPLIHIFKGNSKEGKLKVWFQGGLHGDEQASTEGMLYLMDQLLTNPAYSKLLDNIYLEIVPMANIDGSNKSNRYAANGLDLNRDQTKLMMQETIALKIAFNAFDPDVAVDFHEYRPFRRDYARLSTYGVSSPYDVMFLYSGNLNVPENLRNFTYEEFVKPACHKLDENNLNHHDYFTSTKVKGAIQFNQGSVNARSSASSFALTNAVSTLIEVRGGGLGRTSLRRRVYSTFLVAISYLESASKNIELVKNEIAMAESMRADAIVSSKRLKEERKLLFIDVESNDTLRLDAVVNDAWKSSPKMKRSRPVAYIIDKEQSQISDRLAILGVKIDTIKSAVKAEVETYEVTEYYRNAEKYEGMNMQEVTAQIGIATIEFSPGTFVIYMDQPKSNLVIEVLEPEAPNSIVSWNILETGKGKIIPIYRYLKSDRL